MHKHLALFILVLSLASCQPEPESSQEESSRSTVDSLLTREQIADKTLGLLIGSAIGDAMGAPTEMWHRMYIRMHYGHVDTLDPHTREASPEGPWVQNLPSGGTTDDTRWKQLTAAFLSAAPADADTLNPRAFAQSIIDSYLQYISALKQTDDFRPEPFEREARRMSWLQEWALVAKPYVENDYEGYITALNRFYGGEMVCAGLLYAPLVGMYYPGKPALAYQEAYRIGIFDHGYARDITALAAAVTAAASAAGARKETSLDVIRDIDPQHFFQSRLVGRSAYRIYREAWEIAYTTREFQPEEEAVRKLRLPARWKGSAEDFLRREHAFELLDAKLQDAPFHAGEIWLITLTAILINDWAFEPSIEFIVNFGRDNDTVAAVAGAILGAYHGASGLPPGLSATVLQVNRDSLGIDLETTAMKLSETIWRRHPSKKAL